MDFTSVCWLRRSFHWTARSGCRSRRVLRRSRPSRQLPGFGSICAGRTICSAARESSEEFSLRARLRTHRRRHLPGSATPCSELASTFIIERFLPRSLPSRLRFSSRELTMSAGRHCSSRFCERSIVNWMGLTANMPVWEAVQVCWPASPRHPRGCAGKRVQVPEEGGYTGVTAGLDARGFLLVDERRWHAADCALRRGS